MPHIMNPIDLLELDIQRYKTGTSTVQLQRHDDFLQAVVYYQIVFEYDLTSISMPDARVIDDLRVLFELVYMRRGARLKSYRYDPTIRKNEYGIEVTEQALGRLRGMRPAPGTLSFTQAAVTAAAAANQFAQVAAAIKKTMPKPVKIVKKIQTEVEIGYRDFIYLKKGNQSKPILLSRNGVPWPKYEPLIASCNGDPFVTHDAPHDGCNCGIYAFNRPDNKELKPEADIWGEIALWGKVIVCKDGYRAQYAYPQNIFIRDVGTQTVRSFRDDIEREYGVPVHLVKERGGKKASELMADMISEWAYKA